MPSLGVNIDHVATLRQARYARMPDVLTVEPDIVRAAMEAEAGGAVGITVHLRADRRHIQDADLWELKKAVKTKINLELGNTPEIVGIAMELLPQDVCLVPETREEITTEGGLDCVAHASALSPTIDRFGKAGVVVSLFIDPEPAQIRMAAELGAPVVELHTGAFANAQGEAQARELARLAEAAELARAKGLQVNAGHGINYGNIDQIMTLPHLAELNIGHSIVSRAVFVGLRKAVEEMASLIEKK